MLLSSFSSSTTRKYHSLSYGSTIDSEQVERALENGGQQRREDDECARTRTDQALNL